jgi:S1-C subfamily serine protease
MTSMRVLAVTLLLLSAAPALTAHNERPRQGGMRRLQFDADKAVIMQETGMVVVEKDGKLKVEFLPPAGRRPKETADADIAEGDEVGMAAGKKVTTAKELRAAYEAAKPGDEFKIGLRRDGRAVIVTFKKMDEKDLPKQMVIRREGGENPNRDLFPALGIGIELKDGRVLVAETLPNAPEGMESGDVIVSLNGTKVASVKGFSEVFDGVEVGGALKFELLRGGKTVTVEMKRPKPRGRVIVD